MYNLGCVLLSGSCGTHSVVRLAVSLVFVSLYHVVYNLANSRLLILALELMAPNRLVQDRGSPLQIKIDVKLSH